MNRHHSMIRTLNDKIHSTLEVLGWIIQKGLLVLRFSLFLFVFCFTYRYGMELYYPDIPREGYYPDFERGLNTAFRLGMASEDPEPHHEAPELFPDYDQEQRVLAAQNRYDLLLIGQSLKVGLDMIWIRHGTKQILKVSDTEIYYFKPIDFMENTHRIWCVQRALETLLKIFWESVWMSLIFSSIFLWIFKKIDRLTQAFRGEKL